MKKPGYYSSGEFAKLSLVTKKTLRYYDEKSILKPSFVSQKGARFYTDSDLAKLQQILLLKYLGFSLSDIKEMMVRQQDNTHVENMLKIQEKLVEDRMDQLGLVHQMILEAQEEVKKKQDINWSQMLELMRITSMENSMQSQYRNASNISARISLHRLYSQNPVGWFSFLFDQIPLKPGCSVLEVGCGDGSLWKDRMLPDNTSVVLTDKSDGMLRDAKRNIKKQDSFSYVLCDCQSLPFEEEQFDIVVANHVLFYCDDMEAAIREISRVLKKDGVLLAGTYGRSHMKEIGELVQQFDDKITLAAEHLYDLFGKENGKNHLEPFFSTVNWIEYEDSLCVTEAEPLISYVLSCHGNQNRYIVDCYNDFKTFVKKKTDAGFHISKEAGTFFAKNKKDLQVP